MAIQVPQFNVPLLSPASLLSGSERRQDTSFEDAMADARRLDMERRLLAERNALDLQRDEIQRAFTLDRDFQQDLTAGRLTAVPEGGFAFPGSEDLTRIQAPKGGAEYVRTGDLQRITPFTEWGGRATREGTMVSDVIDPSTGQINTTLAEGRTIADRDAALAALDGLARFRPDLAASMREEIMSDDFFSVSEYRDVMNQASSDVMINYASHVRQMQNMDRQDRALFNNARVNLNQEYQLLVDNGDTVEVQDLNEAQQLAFAKYSVGMPLTASEQAVVDQINNREAGILVPRRDNIDMSESLLKFWQEASIEGNTTFNTFARWIEGLTIDDDDNVIISEDSPLGQSILSTGGSINPSGIMTWAKSAASAPYRAAFALERLGWNSRAEVERRRDRGQDFPWGVESAMRAYAELDPAFGEPIAGTSSNSTTPPGEPMTGSQLEQLYSDPTYGSLRRGTMSLLEDLDTDALTRIRQAVTMDDPAEVEQSFASSARAYEEAGNEEVAAVFRQYAEGIGNNPSQYLTLRDSILVPTLEYLNRNN